MNTIQGITQIHLINKLSQSIYVYIESWWCTWYNLQGYY